MYIYIYAQEISTPTIQLGKAIMLDIFPQKSQKLLYYWNTDNT